MARMATKAQQDADAKGKADRDMAKCFFNGRFSWCETARISTVRVGSIHASSRNRRHTRSDEFQSQAVACGLRLRVAPVAPAARTSAFPAATKPTLANRS